MALEPLSDYSAEVRFHVGQRVIVDWKLAILNPTAGTITDMRTRFPHTPAMREIRCRVQLDQEVVHQWIWWMPEGSLRLEESDE